MIQQIRFRSWIAFLSLTLFLRIDLASAYTVSTHLKVTEQAFQEFNLCRTHLGHAPWSKGVLEKLQSGNAYEDNALIIKAHNWHFYHPTKDLGPGSGGIGHGALNWRFAELKAKVLSSKTLEALGGLTHYVQDVTNPAHVAPVFHSIGDAFDGYLFDKLMTRNLSVEDCKRLAEQIRNKDYWETLQRVASGTLEALTEKFDYERDRSVRSTTWEEAFWDTEYSSQSKQSGFGHYGFFGNRFGNPVIDKSKIKPSTYEQFAKNQIHQALNATLQYLFIFSGQ